MQLGINLLCLSGYIDETHLPQIGRLKTLGYDGVEIPVLSGNTDHYTKLGRELDAIGLERTTTSIIASPDASPISSDAEIRKAGKAQLDWALDCAEALGAKSVGGPFHAPLGHFTGSGPTPDEIAYGIEAHREMAEKAAARGIYLSLEPLNRFETYFLNTLEQARDYAGQVDHPAFRIMADTFHANIEDKHLAQAFGAITPHIGVLHVSENDRGVPGTGHIDFPAVFSAVKQAGYDGWVVIEAFGSGLPELAAATRVWRPLFPDFETLFAQSADYVRRTWEAAR